MIIFKENKINRKTNTFFNIHYVMKYYYYHWHNKKQQQQNQLNVHEKQMANIAMNGDDKPQEKSIKKYFVNSK